MENVKQSKGRQKIEIKRIESEDDRYATFSKRRNGIFKKASELSISCKADIGVIIFSPTNKPYSFFHPSMDIVFDRFLQRNQDSNNTTRLVEAHVRAKIDQLNQKLDEVESLKEIEGERAKNLHQLLSASDEENGYSWDQSVKEFNLETAISLKSWLSGVLRQLNNHAYQLNNVGASSSSSGPSKSIIG